MVPQELQTLKLECISKGSFQLRSGLPGVPDFVPELEVGLCLLSVIF